MTKNKLQFINDPIIINENTNMFFNNIPHTMDNITMIKNTNNRANSLITSIGDLIVNIIAFKTTNIFGKNSTNIFKSEPKPPVITSNPGIFGVGILNPGNPI